MKLNFRGGGTSIPTGMIALKPELGIRRHMKDHHKAIELSLRKKVIDYAEGLRLVVPERVPMPERTHAPINGLALLDGYECKDCVYACPSEDNMKLHHKMKHGWHKAQGCC